MIFILFYNDVCSFTFRSKKASIPQQRWFQEKKLDPPIVLLGIKNPSTFLNNRAKENKNMEKQE